MVEEVEHIVPSMPDVQSVDRLRVRWLGHGLEVSMAITVDCDLNVSQGHRVSEEVRHRLVHEVRRLDTVVIHVNPCGHTGDDPHALTRHHDSVASAPLTRWAATRTGVEYGHEAPRTVRIGRGVTG